MSHRLMSIVRLTTCNVGMAVLLTSASSAATYYVGPYGSGSDSNNCLSTGASCATIGHGLSLMSAGDTLSILHGTYPETVYSPAGGTAGSPITVTADTSGGPVVVRPTGAAYSLVIQSTSSFYTIYDGIVWDGGGANTVSTVYSSSTNGQTTLKNGEVRNSTVDCVHLEGNGVTLRNMNIHDCGAGNGRYGIALYGSDNVIDACTVHDVDESGALMYYGAGGNIIRFSEFYNAGDFGIELVSTGTGNIVHNNRIHDNASDGTRIGYGATGAAVLHNAIYKNDRDGIDVYSSSTNAVLIDNVCYGNALHDIEDAGDGTILEGNLAPQ